MSLEEKIAQMVSNSAAIPRLNVPAYNWWNECLHGVARGGTATVFPQVIAMAASFNVELLYMVASAISDEARAKYNQYKTMGYTEAYQGLTFWSPNINIFRDPRWGRGHETYGEDPFLTGRMASAFIRGLQGDHPVYRKLDATLKHYLAHSGPEKSRHSFNAMVSEEDLRDTYLPAFKYCIENARPSAVMGAYNRINGEACCASPTYLKKLLYDELGFDGYVVSDCGAIMDIHANHHITEDTAASAAMAVNNGCTLNCGSAFIFLYEAWERGLIEEGVITRAVERLFAARFRLGMFDDDVPYDDIPISVVESSQHLSLSRRMAQESIVLLKNDGLLPLSKYANIAVIGPGADDKSVLLANYSGTPSQYATLLSGIRNASLGCVEYVQGCHHFEKCLWWEHPANEAILAARRSDVIILCMGLTPYMEGEEGDAYNSEAGGDKPDLELPQVQKELLEAIVGTGKPVVFINISGSCLNLTRADETCGAVVQCFYPGGEGGHALADVLFGDVSPSGRLPITFYRNVDDLPPFDDYSMENRTYRYYKGDPLYRFGHGLSYSRFVERWIDDSTVVVENVGAYDSAYSILRYEDATKRKLTGFKKIFLRKGENFTVKFDDAVK